VYIHKLLPSDTAHLLKTGMIFAIESGIAGAKSEYDILLHRIAKFATMIGEAG
jgi:hypothetical protein